MRTQACEPCAKRKVRCDRAEPPCSNCKRRKRDHCSYPEVSPFERIRKLEDTVRSLSGDAPEKTRGSSVVVNTVNTAASEGSAQTPIIVQEEGRSVYHESEGWHSWIDVTRLCKGAKPHFNASDPRNSSLSPGKFLPHAFQGSPWINTSLCSEGLPICPIPAEEAVKLWNLFMERVEPLVKISFKWTLDHLQAALTDAEKWTKLEDGEQALALSSCLFGAMSLATQECVGMFGRSKASLTNDCRFQCDVAFSRISLLAIDDISTLKALCIYIKANVDALSSRSLWSLMGLVCRNAEQLGFHRDGAALGLSPVETEERRRLWWQLRHVDLILSIKTGLTPLSFGAAWDVKLPLNIEDSDIDPKSQVVPKERTGLTSFSYTLYTYYIMEKQRGFRTNQTSDGAYENSLLGCLADTIINDLEQGINKMFLQYCDPINPLHMILQLSGRALVNVMRLRNVHEARMRSKHGDDDCHIEHFNTCMQAMKYIVVSHSNPQLKPFAWLMEVSFVWHAFIGILVDIPNLSDVTMIQSAWTLLAELYSVTAHISDLSEDRRNLHAAKSVVTTWYECQQKPGLRDMEKPRFVSDLERRLWELDGNGNGNGTGDASSSDGQANLQNVWQNQTREDELLPFGFEFADIDWAFWDSMC
ncbi:hypothetical protein BKA59DRAFT_475417 [Fusarium tricinctum]|uniref:Zn(2)-C6 fungal-type domain-containing protein n=1 Tax=Fusarium tricinctum TaxID=61284 RepID=A0A8K0WBL1_9HYPO|nr:hypothetical protein BKA59DRAFT_475417 [Fusarium tricinctum]